MKFFYDFIDFLSNSGYEMFEDKKTFKVEFKYNHKIKDFLKYTSVREMKFYFCDCISLYSYKTINYEENIFDYLDEEEEFNQEINKIDETYNFKLIIDKSKFVEAKINIDANVIFFVKSTKFIDFFNMDISTLEESLFNIDKKNIFIFGNSEEFFFNEFYMVTNLKRQDFLKEITGFLETINTIDIQAVIDKRNELCNWIDGSHSLTPEVIYIDATNPTFVISNELKIQLFKRCTDLIIPFLSNFTGNISNRYLSVVNGNKRIEIYYDLDIKDYNQEINENLYKLYKWIYEKSTFDKINICRNVISILITAKCQGSEYKTILQNSDWLVKSVLDNFEGFLQRNIEAYFKEKNTITDKLAENIASINNQISELTKLIITNITSLLGTAIAAVVGYVAKGEVVFIRMLIFLYLCFLVTNSIFNLPISIIRAIQSRNDFEYNKKLYIKLYTDDDKINKLIKRNNFNLSIFIIYTVLSGVLIVAIIFYLINTDINEFITKFK
jgi:uncharacterized Tic20 family protein